LKLKLIKISFPGCVLALLIVLYVLVVHFVEKKLQNKNMSSPRTVVVPTPNLVPTLKLKQAKRQEFIKENDELEFSFRKPNSEAASALALGTLGFVSSERSLNSRGATKITKDDLYSNLMKKKKKSEKKRFKKSKSSPYKKLVTKKEVASPKITKNLFFISLDKKIYPDRRLKKVKKQKQDIKDVDVYAPRIKQKLPILPFEQAGIIGQRMFKELLADVEEIKKRVDKVHLLNKKNKQQKNVDAKKRHNSNNIGKSEINPNNKSNPGAQRMKSSTVNMRNNAIKVKHSSKIHQIFCSLCLDEFENMQKYKLHQKYSCKERRVKCHNPCCRDQISISRMDYHIKHECRWVKYTDVVLKESNQEHDAWPKVQMRGLKHGL
jgi:hypothetical protein